MSSPQHKSKSVAFWSIVATQEIPELGPGPRRSLLSQRDLEARMAAFAREQELEGKTSDLLLASALLYHDHHDPAHDIVQDLKDVEAAIIHAILHRREPDYWNSKYWFRRFDTHPMYLSLGRRVAQWGQDPWQKEFARKLTLPGAFDSFAFVDLCEAYARKSASDPEVLWLRSVQHAEFEELVLALV